MRKLTVLLAVLIIALAACAEEGDPTEAAEDYMRAQFDSDADKLRQLSCPDHEAAAIADSESFAGFEDVTVDSLSCEEDGTDGDYTIVACEAAIEIAYPDRDNFSREVRGRFLMRDNDGEWEVCGEAE